MSRLAITRQWAVIWLRERARLTSMSRRDAACWASARNMADLGEMVVAWLGGEVAQTPGHCGPPCAETIPLIPVLTLVNRAGFVTENSQLAGKRGARTWNAWVEGFASADVVARLRKLAEGTELFVTACRGGDHEHEGSLIRHLAVCPHKAVLGFWSQACPDVAGELDSMWSVLVADPEDGRNDRLWPAPRGFRER